MPSIPQSLLWISLVVLWLFVLVPMLISRRETVRRTSDVALSTRVLNSGKSRLIKRRGPLGGHHHDPDWQPARGGFENLEDDDQAEAPTRSAGVVKAATVADVDSELDYLDVDVVDEDSGALPVGGARRVTVEQPSLFDPAPVDEVEDLADPVTDPVTDQLPIVDESVDMPQVAETEPVAESEAEASTDELVEELPDDEYDYAESSSAVQSGEAVRSSGTDEEITDRGRSRADRGSRAEGAGANRARRFESATAAAVSARKYQFRKRVLMGMAVLMFFTAILSFTTSPGLWWLFGSVTGVAVLYLAYLRRQTRIEEQVRRRRQQRMARSRAGVENTQDREFDVVPSRLRRPGAAVLEIDDEDPVFEHLDEVAFARQYDLPRAAGQ